MKLNIAIILAMLTLTSACQEYPWQQNDQQSQEKPIVEPTPTPTITSIQPLEADNSQDSTLVNLGQILKGVNLPSDRKGKGQGIRIAILDQGFSGLENSLGKRLPPHIKVEDESATNVLAESTHGTKLAELVYAVATGSINYDEDIQGPEIFLFNANGFPNLVTAIDGAIKKNVDIILYAQVWEFGGNRDGKGFINAEVNRAIDAGILWVNASGNYGKSAYTAKVELNKRKDGLVLPFQEKYLRLSVPRDGTQVKISLAWNDFKEDIKYRTAQDLNLYLEDETGTVIKSMEQIQDGLTHEKSDGYSAHAREVFTIILNAGVYHLRVGAKSDNFTDESKFWISADGANVAFLDVKHSDSLFIPNDNPRVLAVGASDVDYSSYRADENGKILKPQVKTVSRVNFDSGESYSGTSAASAIAVGQLAAVMSEKGHMSFDTVVNFIECGKLSQKVKLNSSRAEFLPGVPLLGVN
jgi:hypothetical protein